MATTYENSKGYKVLVLSVDEIKVWPRAEFCDRCGSKMISSGFYVCAVNFMCCPECYDEWHTSAPEKQGLQNLRESMHLTKAKEQMTEALSNSKTATK